MPSKVDYPNWSLGDWLPVNWIPATEADIEYMDFVRAKTERENNEYIERLKKQHL